MVISGGKNRYLEHSPTQRSLRRSQTRTVKSREPDMKMLGFGGNKDTHVIKSCKQPKYIKTVVTLEIEKTSPPKRVGCSILPLKRALMGHELEITIDNQPYTLALAELREKQQAIPHVLHIV